MLMVRMVVLAGLLLAVVSCGPASGPGGGGGDAAQDRGVVMTTFYPLAYFARRIAGDTVEVQCPVPDDADPSSWQPGADAIRAYQQAEVIFVNGASFEKWVATAPLPRSRIVDTTAGLKDELLHYANATTHSHGPGGSHSHEGIDGHTWLDPVVALGQAEAVRDGLKRAYPEFAAEFDAGFVALAKDLRALDASLRSLADEMDGVTIIASHPAYNYLARRYGWELINVSFDPKVRITETEVASLLAKFSDSEGKRIVLWESAADEGSVRILYESVGASSVVYSPVEAPVDEGFIGGMRVNIDRLADAVRGD